MKSILIAVGCGIFSYGQSRAELATTGTYDTSLQQNSVDKSATSDIGNQLSLSTFKANLVSAFNQNFGGVIDFDNGTLTATQITARYGASQASNIIIVNPNNGWAINSDPTARTAISGTTHLSKSGSAVFDFYFGTQSKVVQIGATLLSRTGASTVNFIGKATYNDSTFDSVTASVSGISNGGDDTFFGFKAPAGKRIVRFTLTPASTSFRSLDDLAFITDGTPETGVTSIFNYVSTVTNDAEGPLDLNAELNYDSARGNAPVMVLMHPFTDLTGQYDAYRDNAIRFRNEGFFVITPAMRQREGSDGIRDNGGVELQDVHDAVEAVKAAYANFLDPTSISITGYSGGGGNTMSALTKFPDYFRAASAYFGMSDYGYDTTNGWYFNGAAVGSDRRPTLNAWPGNPTPPSTPAIIDRYHARASNLASHNNPYSEIHLFVNDNETICPKINFTSYLSNAVAAASFTGEFDNITVHVGFPNLYHDFNDNAVNDSDELQYWPHGDPTEDQQHAGDAWFLDRLVAGQIPAPVLNSADRLFIAGFVRTRRFALWLGDGQNAAADFDYSLSSDKKSFLMNLKSLLPVTGRLDVDTTDMVGKVVEVRRNGGVVATVLAGNSYTFSEIADDETVELKVASPFDAWRFHNFGAGSPAGSGSFDDPDKDGINNLLEFAFNFEPNTASLSDGLPAFVKSAGAPSELFFTYRQRTGGSGANGIDYVADGIRFTVETTGDLAGAWYSGPSYISQVGPPLPVAGGVEVVTLRLTPINSERLFARLRVARVF